MRKAKEEWLKICKECDYAYLTKNKYSKKCSECKSINRTKKVLK